MVGALALSGILLAAPRLLHDLPTTALAAVVIAAALGMFDLRELRVFFRVRRSDFFLALTAFFAVAVLGVITGIAVAVSVSILDFVRRAWRPHDAILGRADGVKGYHDLKRYPDARQIPGLVMLRWDAPLFFANADTFRARVLEVLAAAEPRPAWLVIAAEPITDVDTTAAEMLEELDKELHTLGVELAFAEMKDPVRDRLDRYGLTTRIGDSRFFPTIGVAAKAYLAAADVTSGGLGRGVSHRPVLGGAITRRARSVAVVPCALQRSRRGCTPASSPRTTCAKPAPKARHPTAHFVLPIGGDGMTVEMSGRDQCSPRSRSPPSQEA